MNRKPKRIQRKRTKGWKMPPNTVYVGRGSKWGNPFKVYKTSSVEAFNRVYGYETSRKETTVYAITKPIKTNHDYWFGKEVAIQQSILRYKVYLLGKIKNGELNISELRGKNIACWCPLNHPCHADVLLEIANENNK